MSVDVTAFQPWQYMLRCNFIAGIRETWKRNKKRGEAGRGRSIFVSPIVILDSKFLSNGFYQWMTPTLTVTTMNNNPAEKLLTIYCYFAYYTQGYHLHAISPSRFQRQPSQSTIQHCFVFVFFFISTVQSHFSHGRFEVSFSSLCKLEIFDSHYYIYCKLRSLNPLFFGVVLNSFPLDQFIKVSGTLIPPHTPRPVSLPGFDSEAQGICAYLLISSIWWGQFLYLGP